MNYHKLAPLPWAPFLWVALPRAPLPWVVLPWVALTGTPLPWVVLPWAPLSWVALPGAPLPWVAVVELMWTKKKFGKKPLLTTFFQNEL